MIKNTRVVRICTDLYEYGSVRTTSKYRTDPYYQGLENNIMSFLSTVHDADAASDDESDDEVSEIMIDASMLKRGRPCVNDS